MFGVAEQDGSKAYDVGRRLERKPGGDAFVINWNASAAKGRMKALPYPLADISLRRRFRHIFCLLHDSVADHEVDDLLLEGMERASWPREIDRAFIDPSYLGSRILTKSHVLGVDLKNSTFSNADKPQAATERTIPNLINLDQEDCSWASTHATSQALT